MSLLSRLERRGLIAQTMGAELEQYLEKGERAIYIGFDPTSDSLHVGSLIPLMVAQEFLRAGHRVIILLGTTTGMIGDPSGKDQERTLLDSHLVNENADALEEQIAEFLGDDPNLEFVENVWWFNTTAVELLRDYGKHFSVNQMINLSSVKNRIDRESGISFTEFAYSVFQAGDFLQLFRRYGVTIQFGATDQIGNMGAGIELVRRVEGEQVYGLALPLLTDSEGNKYGKSVGGSAMLDPKKTSPFDFYQFWLRVPDDRVDIFMRYFDVDDAPPMSETPEPNWRQMWLARTVTELVHGEKTTNEVIVASRLAFSTDLDLLTKAAARHLPQIQNTNNLVDALISGGLAASKTKARNLIAQGAVWVNGKKVDEKHGFGEDHGFANADSNEHGVIHIRAGKKIAVIV